MRKKMSKQLLATCLAAATVIVSLSGCGQKKEESSEQPVQNTEQSVQGSSSTESESTVSEEVVVDKSKLPTLTFFGNSAGVAGGLVEGFRGDYLAENGFNLEVWSYSPEKLTAIINSGDLPDIMFIQKGENLDALIENEAIINFDEHLDKIPNLLTNSYTKQQQTAVDMFREHNSNGTGKLYGIPLNVGPFNDVYGFSKTGTNQIMLNWKIYEEIGAPEIKDYWQLIDVMEQMMKAHPEAEDGTKIYATTMDPGMDTTYWGCMRTWFIYQGYHFNLLQYMVEVDVVNDTTEYILTKDSKYYEGLKWYNEMFRRGLIDPDSINTDRATNVKKVDSGYCMVPAGTLTGYTPIYYPYYIEGTNIYSKSEESNFTYAIVVNAETEYLDECLNFVNMWIDPDNYLRLQYEDEDASTLWYVEDGVAHLTDEFKAHLAAGNPINSYKFSDGTEYSFFNTLFGCGAGAYTSFVDADGNPLQASITKWPEYIAAGSENPTLKLWQKTMGYDNWNELVDDKGVFYGDGEYNYYNPFLQAPSDDAMKLAVSSVKDIIVNGCWKAVYAETEADFDAIWDKMVADAEAGGAKDIFDWKIADIANARKLAGR